MGNSDNFKKAFEIYSKIKNNILSVFKGNPFNIDLLLGGYFTNGHILLEDYPGTGKTTLAKALALSIQTDFKRIQFTPDLLPTDITGVNVFNVKEREFFFKKDLYLQTFYSLMKLIEQLPGPNQHYLKLWRKNR